MDIQTPANAAAFTPVTIGTTPAGSVWVARKASDVAVMTSRLRALKIRHAAKRAKANGDSVRTANSRVMSLGERTHRYWGGVK